MNLEQEPHFHNNDPEQKCYADHAEMERKQLEYHDKIRLQRGIGVATLRLPEEQASPWAFNTKEFERLC